MESVYLRTLSFNGPSRTIGYIGSCVRELWDMSRCDCRRLPTWDCLKLRTFEEECTSSRCAMSRSTVCEKFRRKEMEKLAEIMIIGYTVKVLQSSACLACLHSSASGNIVSSSNKYKQVSPSVCAGAESESSEIMRSIIIPFGKFSF